MGSHKTEDEKEEKNTYLSFKELQHLLKVQKVEEEKEKEINQIEIRLDEERRRNQDLQNTINELKAGAVVGVNNDDVLEQLQDPPLPVQDDGLNKFRKMLEEGLKNSKSDKPP